MRNKLLLITLAGLMASCSSMSEKECLNAEWKLIGFEDASQGKPESSIGSYRKDCSKVNVVPDLNLYQQGHKEGARKYCVKTTGYQSGVSGGAYYGICPADLESIFLTAYRDGQALFVINRDIHNMQSRINRFQIDMKDRQQEIKAHEQAIVDSRSSSKERREHLDAIKQLRDQVAELQVQLDDESYSLARRQDDAQRLRLQHQRLGY
jgi:hypothetical protein